MNKFLYAYSKLGESIEVFMTGSGGDKDKIKSVYIYYLDYLTPDKLPDSCNNKMNYIRDVLTDAAKQKMYDPNNHQGTVYWNVASLHYTKVRKIKRYIWEMYQEIESEMRNQ